ncbi:MAG: hypothetical protein AAF492_21905, partial [Verrucomicrobiota bacterium]
MPTFKKGYRKYYGDGLIRRTTSGTYVGEFNRDRKRVRKTFDEEPDAKAWLESMGVARRDEGKTVTSLTGRQADDALRSLALLEQSGLSVDLYTAVTFYVRHNAHKEQAGTVHDWIGKHLEHLRCPTDGG